MKKTIFTVLTALTVASSVFAQDYKQAAGNKSLELQFTPVGGTPIGLLPIGNGGISFRYFKTDKMAFRLNANIGISSSKDYIQQGDTVSGPSGKKELTHHKSSVEIGLQPGVLWFFEGTDRLAPYWGAQLDFGMKTSTDKTESQYWVYSEKKNETRSLTLSNQDGFIRVGAGLVAGLDYYFAKKIYCGAEMGFGFGLTKQSKVKQGSSDEVLNKTLPTDIKQGSMFAFGPTYNAKIRLGFLF